MCGNVAVEGRATERFGQRLRPLGDAEPFQKHALRGQQRVRGGGGSAGERLKIHMGGQVRSARKCYGIDGRMALERLKCVAQRSPVAIVDDQRHAALRRNAGAKHGGNSLTGRAGFHKIAVFRIVLPVAEAGLRGGRGEAEGKVIFLQADHAFAPVVAVTLELADWQRVEKFVGDKVQRAVGQGLNRVVPCGLRQTLGLFGAQGGRCFDQM